MRLPRWPRTGTIPLMLLAAVAAGAAWVAPAPSGGGPPPLAPEPCPAGARGDSAARGARVAPGSWWRLDPVIDPSGTLVGQSLAAGGRDGREFRLALPPESFAAGPTSGSVVIGADDGSRSRLSILEPGTGCIRPVATERAVVRRAVIDPAGTAIVEFRVDRTTRADLGVWRRPVDGSGAVERILGAIAPDPRFGETWVTDLAWTDDGRLAVTSCGAAACRTRLLSDEGRVTLIDDPDLGEPLGFAGHELLSYLACRGLPCPIEAVDLDDGSRRRIVAAAGVGALMAAGGDTGAAIVHEPLDRPAEAGRVVELVPLDGSAARRVTLDDDSTPVGTPGRSRSAIELEPGTLALDAGGRVGSLRTVTILRPDQARPMPAQEVLR